MVIGNLLKNAREACFALPKERRRVSLKAISDNIKLVLEVTNSFDGTIQTDKDGMPVRSKESGGYGLQSVFAVCKLHEGLCHPVWDKDEFSVYVVLNF